jgi:hypothetical protein
MPWLLVILCDQYRLLSWSGVVWENTAITKDSNSRSTPVTFFSRWEIYNPEDWTLVNRNSNEH